MLLLSPQPPEAYTLDGYGIGQTFVWTPDCPVTEIRLRAAWNLLYLSWPALDGWLKGHQNYHKDAIDAVWLTLDKDLEIRMTGDHAQILAYLESADTLYSVITDVHGKWWVEMAKLRLAVSERRYNETATTPASKWTHTTVTGRSAGGRRIPDSINKQPAQVIQLSGWTRRGS